MSWTVYTQRMGVGSRNLVAEKQMDDKTNELTTLPSILSSLWLIGTIVSVGAMGAHRHIAEQIILQRGDFLMPLKVNQPILIDLTEGVFNRAVQISTYTTEDRGHGDWKKEPVPFLMPYTWNRKACTSNGRD